MTNTSNPEPGASQVPSSVQQFLAHIERSGVLPPDVTATDAATAVLRARSTELGAG